MPTDVAVRQLAARLARLTQTDGSSSDAAVVHQEAQITRILHALLDDK